MNTNTYTSLMERRVRRILLVCNNYDSFALEEDGRIDVQIAQEYAELNLSNPPSITRAETTDEALEHLSPTLSQGEGASPLGGEGLCPIERPGDGHRTMGREVFIYRLDFRLGVDGQQPLFENFHFRSAQRLPCCRQLAVDVGRLHRVAIDNRQMHQSRSYQRLRAPRTDTPYAEEDHPFRP